MQKICYNQTSRAKGRIPRRNRSSNYPEYRQHTTNRTEPVARDTIDYHGGIAFAHPVFMEKVRCSGCPDEGDDSFRYHSPVKDRIRILLVL